MNDILADWARTEWIAAGAASALANKVPLDELETEELECLRDVVSAELRKREE